MKKILIVVLILILGALVFMIMRSDNSQVEAIGPDTSLEAANVDVLDTTFVLDGKEFVLVDGKASYAVAPDSASVETLAVFGTPVYGDLDKDGDEDAALLLQLTTGGSGIFYYAGLVLYEGETHKTTNLMYLGDRIAPQTLEIIDGRAVYNFAERRADEPMTTPPSVGRSVYVHYDRERNEIGEWAKDFEGESDYSERFGARVDRVDVVFEHTNFTQYRLITNGLVREGELNTERGFEDDPDATVYVLNWQKPEGEQILYVKLTSEPTKLYVLDAERKIITGSALTLEE